jgi:tetratricopeptide (TPR) repeat protein
LEPTKTKKFTPQNSGRVINKKKLILIGLIVMVVLVGVIIYLNYSKKFIFIKPALISKEDIVKNYFDGATTGRDATGRDLTSEQRQALYNKSAELLSTYIQTNSNDVGALNDLAGAYYNTGNLDKAEETLKKILALDSSSASALIHNNLANILRDGGKIIEAEEHYKQSIELYPDLIAPYYNYAAMLGGLENKKDESIKIIQEGLVKNPEDATLKNLLIEYQKTQ